MKEEGKRRRGARKGDAREGCRKGKKRETKHGRKTTEGKKIQGRGKKVIKGEWNPEK